jgi:hypothetical protein
MHSGTTKDTHIVVAGPQQFLRRVECRCCYGRGTMMHAGRRQLDNCKLRISQLLCRLSVYVAAAVEGCGAVLHCRSLHLVPIGLHDGDAFTGFFLDRHASVSGVMSPGELYRHE